MTLESPGFSSFRKLMDIWDSVLEEEARDNAIQTLLDGQGLILFFRKGDGLFGAPEESRVTFARLKNPDSGEDGFAQDANFLAVNLLDALMGKKTQTIFTHKDLPKIKIINRDKCHRLLLDKAKQMKEMEPSVVIRPGEIQGDDDGLVPMGDD
jgi:hypothetical protein